MDASTLTSQIPQNGTIAMTGFNNGHNAFKRETATKRGSPKSNGVASYPINLIYCNENSAVPASKS